MCGIAGFLIKKNKNASEISRKLLFGLQERGEDAVGLSFFQDGEVQVFKSQGKVKNFVSKHWDKIWQRPVDSAVILHCRAATSGTASSMVNNHPIFSKKLGVSLVHNGIIWGVGELIKKYNLQTDGDCDSEVILRMIEHFYKGNWEVAIKKAYKELTGSMACALLTRKDDIYLWRNSMPLTVAHIPSLGGFVFASTKGILKMGISEISTLFNYFVKLKAPRAYYQSVEEDTLVRITPGNIKVWKLPKQKERYDLSELPLYNDRTIYGQSQIGFNGGEGYGEEGFRRASSVLNARIKEKK